METAWDRKSTNYSKHTDLRPTDPHYGELAKYFPTNDASMTLLDLGCGLGYELDNILPKLPKAKITCLDISGVMLNKLVERLSAFSSQIETCQGSYVTAELGHNKYDAVISAFTVHHLPKPTKLMLFKKIRYALKDGGSYIELDGVASIEQELTSQENYRKKVSQLKDAELGNWNFDMCLTLENEIQLLSEAGFSNVHVPWKDTDAESSGRAIFVAEK